MSNTYCLTLKLLACDRDRRGSGVYGEEVMGLSTQCTKDLHFGGNIPKQDQPTQMTKWKKTLSFSCFTPSIVVVTSLP